MIRNPQLLFAATLPLCALLHGCAGTGRYAGFEIPQGTRGTVVMAALDERGTRYRYGGSSPGQALDCSALTLHAHRAAGVRIPRVTAAQHRSARPVSASRLRAGDLVFFSTEGGEHVGLMVDGERFVHASTAADGVKVARLTNPYWRTRLVGAGTYLD
jgi:cell wall-associated NlpC family hydrolase